MKRLGRVLVVDDEENIRFVVSTGLRSHGYDVRDVATGREASELVDSWRPDVIVLDVMLPDVNGFDLLTRLRKDDVTTPVVFLTARDSTGDRVRGLTDGGNDYVTKPFAVAEVVARVRLRLSESHGSDGRRLRGGPIELDSEAHEVTVSGVPVHLSPTEFDMLETLLLNTGVVLSREQILTNVWGHDFDGDPAIVDRYVSYLRRKLGDGAHDLVRTVRGVGFTIRRSS